jgi:hypothetical protein
MGRETYIFSLFTFSSPNLRRIPETGPCRCQSFSIASGSQCSFSRRERLLSNNDLDSPIQVPYPQTKPVVERMFEALYSSLQHAVR